MLPGATTVAPSITTTLSAYEDAAVVVEQPRAPARIREEGLTTLLFLVLNPI